MGCCECKGQSDCDEDAAIKYSNNSALLHNQSEINKVDTPSPSITQQKVFNNKLFNISSEHEHDLQKSDNIFFLTDTKFDTSNSDNLALFVSEKEVVSISSGSIALASFNTNIALNCSQNSALHNSNYSAQADHEPDFIFNNLLQDQNAAFNNTDNCATTDPQCVSIKLVESECLYLAQVYECRSLNNCDNSVLDNIEFFVNKIDKSASTDKHLILNKYDQVAPGYKKPAANETNNATYADECITLNEQLDVNEIKRDAIADDSFICSSEDELEMAYKRSNESTAQVHKHRSLNNCDQNKLNNAESLVNKIDKSASTDKYPILNEYDQVAPGYKKPAANETNNATYADECITLNEQLDVNEIKRDVIADDSFT